LAKLGDPVWQNDPILMKQPTDLIDEGRARFHQPLTDPMQGLEVLLRDLLDRHEAHRRPGNGLPNGFGIRHIVLVRFDIGFDKLGRHQLYGMPILAKAPRPIVGASTGLHPDHGRGHLGDEGP
jgi:hypothetical protein